MAKFLLLLIVLFIGSNYPVTGKVSLSSMVGYIGIAEDLYSGISDSVKMFTNPTTEPPPEANKKLEGIQNGTATTGKDLKNLDNSMSTLNNETDVVKGNLDVVVGHVGDIQVAATEMHRKLGVVLQKLHKISEELSQIPSAVTKKMEAMLDNILTKLSVKQSMNEELRQLFEHTTRIDTWYKKFLVVTDPKSDLQQVTHDNFYYVVTTDNSDGMQATIDYIHAMFTTKSNTSSVHASLLHFVNANEKLLKFEGKCDLQRSFQEQLRFIYNIVAVCELRVFIMTVFAYHQKQIESQPNGLIIISDDYKYELRATVEKSLIRMSGYLQAMKLATKDSSAEIFRCDQINPVINDHVFRLDNLFGLYYFNVQQISSDCEVEDLNIIDYQGYVDSLDISGTQAFVESYRPRYQCNGRLHNCRRGEKRVFCEAKLGSGKRYEWISNRNEMYDDCNGRYIDTFAYSQCADVICQCSEEGPQSMATRAFNLRPQFSDIKNNKVVTNVRLRKKDNVVHIQVQQGTLLPEGHVDEENLEWVPLGKFIRNFDVDGQEGFIWTDNQRIESLVEDHDYTYVAHDRAEFNLDDIILETGYVVTGVKFERQKLNPKNGPNLSAIRLKVHATKFNYVEGTLTIPTQDEEYDLNNEQYFKWYNSSMFDVETDINYSRGRSELSMEGRRDSLKGVGNEFDARPNEFVKFQPSNFEEDFGQTTIPYFDSRPAVIKGGMSLSGVGITHRGVAGYGGYIAPKVFSTNHAEYIEFNVDIEMTVDKIVRKLDTEKGTTVKPTVSLNEEDYDA